MALAGVAAAVSCVLTAKSLVEAFNGGDVIGFGKAAVSLVQKIPIPGGAEAAVVGSRSADVATTSSGRQTTISLADISLSQLAEAFNNAKEKGMVTVFHLDNDRSTTQRFLVIGGDGQLSLQGGGGLPSNAAPADNLVSGPDLGKILSAAQQMASVGIELTVGPQAAALFNSAAQIVRHIAKIRGLGSASAPDVKQMAVHQELGNAVASARGMLASREDCMPKECLQVNLQPINSVLPEKVGGGKFTVFDAQPDFGILQRVDGQKLTHTYFISQVLGEVQDMMHLTEFISGVDPVTGKPVFTVMPVGGKAALEAAMTTSGFDAAISPPPRAPTVLSDSNSIPLSNQQKRDALEKKKDEAIHYHAASAAYYLSASCNGARGATPAERLKNYFADQGDSASPELREAVFMEGDDDYAILYNEKTKRTFTLVRGTEFRPTINMVRDVYNDLFYGTDLVKSLRFKEIQGKVDAYIAKHPGCDGNMFVSGHSLGGGVAVGLGHHNPNLKVMAFNPFGLPPSISFKENEDGSYSLHHTNTADSWNNVSVLHIKNDPLSSIYTRVANQTGGNAETRILPGVSYKSAHDLSNFAPAAEVADAVRKDYQRRELAGDADDGK